ncbi:MAG TPA: response regulator [Polyangiaceae bacterium]
MSRRRVLIVDDEPLVAQALSRLLSRRHHVDTAGGGKEALSLLSSGARYDVILCDISMPDITGLDLYEEVATRSPEQAGRIVFLTGGITSAAQRARLDALSAPVLEKPVEIAQILDIIDDFTGESRASAAFAE